MEKKGEMEDGDQLSNFFKKIFAQVGHCAAAQQQPAHHSPIDSSPTTRASRARRHSSEMRNCVPREEPRALPAHLITSPTHACAQGW